MKCRLRIHNEGTPNHRGTMGQEVLVSAVTEDGQQFPVRGVKGFVLSCSGRKEFVQLKLDLRIADIDLSQVSISVDGVPHYLTPEFIKAE